MTSGGGWGWSAMVVCSGVHAASTGFALRSLVTVREDNGIWGCTMARSLTPLAMLNRARRKINPQRFTYALALFRHSP
jgi:hypothetical protein